MTTSFYSYFSKYFHEKFQEWSKVDPVFQTIALNYPGVRMLRQDPVENLFAFICSSNNNIQRISGQSDFKL